MICSQEDILRLINNNESYSDYTVSKCDGKPNCIEYAIFNQDYTIFLQLNTITNRVELEFQTGSTTKGSTKIYNTFQRDMNKRGYIFVKNTPIGMEYNIGDIASCYVGFANKTSFVEIMYVLKK